MSSFKEDLGAVLELAREVAMNHNENVSLYVDCDGVGFVSNTGVDMVIGYSEPKDKARIR